MTREYVERALRHTLPRLPLHLSNSHAIPWKNLTAHAPSVSRPWRKAGGPVFPLNNEGDDAPKGANLVVLACRSGLAKALAIRASPFGAQSRLFCSRDRASGYWAGLMKVQCSGQAFACLHPHPSSRFRQSPVVGPDGDPRPPESVLARHVRRRRIQTPLRKRPREAPLVSRTIW